ncbi:MAG: hypothetical protein ACHRHE_22525, partial [Tepidisphaerales bacterium]
MNQDRHEGTEAVRHEVAAAPDKVASPGQGLANKIVAAATIIALPVAAAYLYLKTKFATEAGNRDLERSTSYDMAGLQKVDPALIQWREV